MASSSSPQTFSSSVLDPIPLEHWFHLLGSSLKKIGDLEFLFPQDFWFLHLITPFHVPGRMSWSLAFSISLFIMSSTFFLSIFWLFFTYFTHEKPNKTLKIKYFDWIFTQEIIWPWQEFLKSDEIFSNYEIIRNFDQSHEFISIPKNPGLWFNIAHLGENHKIFKIVVFPHFMKLYKFL